MTPGEFRLRVCYGKVGRLRYLSHLEVVHTLERSMRRAGLPFAVTKGFSPHLKVAFGPALPVGTAGQHEYLDVWLTRYTVADEALRMMREVSPQDLSPRSAAYVPGDAPSLTAVLTIGLYTIEIEEEGLGAEEAHEGLSRMIGEGELRIEHKGKHKVFDLSRSIPKEPRVRSREGGVEVDMAVRMGSQGSLRLETLIRTALAPVMTPEAVVRTTRTDTLIESDEGIWSRPV